MDEDERWHAPIRLPGGPLDNNLFSLCPKMICTRDKLSYREALKQVVDEDGVSGLFLRGLQTRILVNALQGALFAVLWKYFQELLRTGGVS